MTRGERLATLGGGLLLLASAALCGFGVWALWFGPVNETHRMAAAVWSVMVAILGVTALLGVAVCMWDATGDKRP